MADGNIEYGVGADVSRATAELNRLKESVDGISAKLIQAQGTMEKALVRMTRDINTSIDKAVKGSDQLLALQRRLNRVEGNTLLNEGRGTRAQQTAMAGGTLLINEINSRNANIEARVKNAEVQALTQQFRTTTAAIDARVRGVEASVRRMISANTPEMIATRDTLGARADQNNIRRASMSDAQYGMSRTMERIGSNGGADIISVQARLLAGYVGLSAAMNVLRNSATFIVQLDSEFRQFQAITATTNFEMIGLKDSLIAVSEQSKFTALEVAQAATLMGQAGLSSAEVAESIESVANLATAAGTTMNESMEVVTSTMSIFNLQTSQAADIANTMTAALNLSKLSMDKLTLGFQYAGNTAAQMGITYQELTGVLGALANSGIRSGSTMGTGLRQLLVDIQNPTAKFSAVLEKLQLTEQDVNVESNGLINVLNTLKEAGFGAAEAFESFEVRAAASYLALANNTDLAVQLQRQFILSSAAVEANAIQMESLSNTWAKFSSVMGTVGYNTFEPVLAGLQDLVNAIADFLSQLNQVPGLLQTVGVAIAGLGSILVISQLSALIRGLIGAVPLFSSYSTAMAGSAVATGAFATATGVATTRLAALSMALRANWITALIGVVVTLATGFIAFGESAQTAADRIDLLKAGVNALEGEANTAVGQIEAIDQTISNLLRQKEALDRDPLMRNAKFLEVKQAFTEIAGEVDTTTGSVNELIEALRNLAQSDFSQLRDTLSETIAANEALIAGYKLLFDEQANAAPQNMLFGSSNFAQFDSRFNRNNADNALSGSIDPNTGILVPPSNEVMSEIFTDLYETNFGPQMAEYAKMAFDSSLLPTDVSEATEVGSFIRSAISDLGAERDDLTRTSKLGTNTDGDEERLRRIPVYIEQLQLLHDQLQPMIKTVIDIANTQSNIDVSIPQQRMAAVQATAEYTALGSRADEIESEVNNKRNDIRSRSRELSAEQLLEEYENLDLFFEEQLAALAEQAQQVRTDLMATGDFTAEDIDSVLGEANASLGGLKAGVVAARDAANIGAQEIRDQIFKEEMEELDDEINLQIGQLRRAQGSFEIDRIEEYVRDAFERKRRMINEIYEGRLSTTTDEDEINSLIAAKRAEQRDVDRAEAEFSRQLTEDRTDQQLEVIQETKDQVDAQISEMDRKLTELSTAIKNARPGPAMDALIAQWEQVAAAQNGLIQQSNAMSGQLGVGNVAGVAIPKSQGDRANQAMQILMGLGYTQAQAAGIVGNLMVESSMNPLAQGDKIEGEYTAYGLGQWRYDRQDKLREYAAQQNKPASDFETQVKFIDWEMKNYRAGSLGTYDELMQQNTASGAADTFRRLYERPNADPSIGHHDRRIAYARGLMGDYSATGQTQEQEEQIRVRDEAIDAANLTGVNTSVNANVKSSNEQIQALISQARNSGSPETTRMIVNSVNDLYETIIAERVRQFNEENKDELELNNPDVIAQRDALVQGLRADMNQTTSQLLGEYWEAVNDKINEPLEEARMALENAQRPENANLYTQQDILNLENNVRIEERKVLVEQLAAAEQFLGEVRQRLAETDEGSPEHTHWLNEQATALEVVAELTRQKNSADAATATQGPSVAAAIQSATQAWAMQRGILDEMGDMVPLAKQVENSWGKVLDTLTSGFSQLFMDLAQGTMTAEEAFKKFALSVIEGFMQMIAEALAMQVVMALMGGDPSSGTGNFLTNLLGVVAPGSANGEYIRGAANGEIIGGISNRDSVLRKVMPGEMILRRSAVDSIGQGALENINNLGSRTISEGMMPEMPANDNPAGSSTVNVWVVSPDQVPPPGPNDIIATVGDNIQRRGVLKQLIQSVQMGSI